MNTKQYDCLASLNVCLRFVVMNLNRTSQKGYILYSNAILLHLYVGTKERARLKQDWI